MQRRSKNAFNSSQITLFHNKLKEEEKTSVQFFKYNYVFSHFWWLSSLWYFFVVFAKWHRLFKFKISFWMNWFFFALCPSKRAHRFHFTTASTELTVRTKTNFLNALWISANFRIDRKNDFFLFRFMISTQCGVLAWRYYAYWIPN